MVELVRIGVGPAAITLVTRETVDHIDESGREMSVDLLECARNWSRSRNSDQFPPVEGPGWIKITSWGPPPDPAAPEPIYVGLRCVIWFRDSPPFCEFFNDRRTRFEFRDKDDLIETMLLRPLRLAGWMTLDLS
jgi:hypothetical protein